MADIYSVCDYNNAQALASDLKRCNKNVLVVDAEHTDIVVITGKKHVNVTRYSRIELNEDLITLENNIECLDKD